MMTGLLYALFAVLAVPGLPADGFLAPCDIAGLKEKARCGTYEVWENREAKTGRRIGLKVVVLPATGPSRESDALTFLAGGPSEAATPAAPFLAKQFAALRERRDILLVDQRGTGGSHALDCDLYPGASPQTALGAFFPADRVRACRSDLERSADLRMYTTANAVDDLDEIRAALGYDRLDLFGVSYGTRAAQVFMRRHPDRARTAYLHGVAPAFDPMPLNFPQYAQHAIDAIFADCRADAACRAAFPDSAAELRAIIGRAATRPIPVDILDSRTGDPVHVSLSRDLLAEALRYLMYESASAVFVPLLVHQAAQGDFAPLAEFALATRRQLVNSSGQGLYLAVTCSEDLPFIKAPEAEREAANTFLGDYRYRQQRAACDAWVRGPVPADSLAPVHADTPTLMVVGSWDPVTPPANAQKVATTLPHSRTVVIPAGGHGFAGLPGVEPCVESIATRFIERGSTDGLDTSCVEGLHRPPFPTRPLETKTVSLSGDQVTALAGHYVAEGAPPVDITIDRGRIAAAVQGEEQQIILVPVSPTRLRMLGDIGSYLTVEIQNGKAGRLTLERSGTPVITWTRDR
jgi:pimeloyl-ACP methyl ester carboxylesterase